MAADPGIPVTLSWSNVEHLIEQLAGQVRRAGTPDTLVGIMRGGMIPAVMIAHRLGIRDVRTIEVTHTASDGINAAKTCAPAYRNPASLGDLAARDVLLVDDIAGSGDTLDRTRRMIEALGSRQLRTAVLAVNQANWQSTPGPDACIDYIAQLHDTWVIFPWENSGSLSSRSTPGAALLPVALVGRAPDQAPTLTRGAEHPLSGERQ